jgi:hypothetical protein
MQRIISAWEFLAAGYFRLLMNPGYLTRKKSKGSKLENLGRWVPANSKWLKA